MSEIGQIIGEDKRRLEVNDEAQIGAFGNVSYFENPRETIYVDPVNIKINKDYPDPGSSFILGHDTIGSLGFSRLGRVGSVVTIFIESKIYEEFDEDFNDTTYFDSGSSNAEWGPRTGSIFILGSPAGTPLGGVLGYYPLGSRVEDGLFFDSGSVAQSFNIGSDIKLSTTKINRVLIELTGSNIYNIIGSVSTNKGTNWTPSTIGLKTGILSEETGSEILVRLIDETMGAHIETMKVTYIQDDI